MQKKQGILRTLFGSTLGNIFEIYDYLIFAYLSPILLQIFLHRKENKETLYQALTIFALSYLARPIGGFLFGPLADRWGRKITLALSTLLMGLATASIGFLPTTSTYLPLILLISFRLFQGFSIGGEYMTTGIYITEFAPNHKRGAYASFINCTVYLGVILSSLAIIHLFSSMDEATLLQGGWRQPFFYGALSIPAALFIQWGLIESPVFNHLKSARLLVKHPIADAFRSHKKPMFITFILVGFQALGFYLMGFFLLTWATTYYNIAFRFANFSLIISSFVVILASFFGGYLSDKIGRKPVLLAGALGIVLLVWPIMVFMTYGGSMETLNIRFAVGQAFFGLFLGLFNGSLAPLLIELFPSRIRGTALQISFSFSAAIFGGTAPIIGFWLLNLSNLPAFPSLYLVAYGILTVIAIIWGFKDPYKNLLTH